MKNILTEGATTGFFIKNPVVAPSKKKKFSGAHGQKIAKEQNYILKCQSRTNHLNQRYFIHATSTNLLNFIDMNAQEFNTSFAQLNPILFSFAMSMTRDTTDAKDLMQETALRAYQHLDRFESGSNFKAWVTTIMRNYFISTCRKKKTRNRVLPPVDDFLFAVENKGADAKVSSSILGQELKVLMNRLSSDHREPFLLHYSGYQYEEISQQMNIPMGTVKSRIYFAKKKMRTMILAHYGEELRAA